MSSIGSDVVAGAVEIPLSVWQGKSHLRSLQRRSARQTVPPVHGADLRIPIGSLEDIVSARRASLTLAKEMGCSGSRVALLLTAVSELARNIICYATRGDIILSTANRGLKRAIIVVARDQGPGISDVSMVSERPMAVANSGSLGLSGLKLCMDHFSIESLPGAGTQVTCELLSD